MRITLAVLLVTIVSSSYSWNIPNLPSGKRSQYFVLHDDGGYKYGYDTGKSYFAKQAGDAHNEVAGHYVYKDITGKDVDVKYTAGVQGFVPEGLEKLLPKTTGPHVPAYFVDSSSNDDQANSGDASYSFTVDTDSYKRHESSDASGNVQGKYSYSNEAGQHDLSYIAGSNTGFVATSGSLSVPNGQVGSYPAPSVDSKFYSASSGSGFQPSDNTPGVANADGSYAFAYSTGDSSRQEHADAQGNVQGRYSYTNAVGTHDLSYIAGSETGFVATGGSLASPNGLEGRVAPYHASGSTSGFTPSQYDSSSDNADDQADTGDASYSFTVDTDEYKRIESSDAQGNVQGRFSYKNAAGQHDLSFVAGKETGFLPTGGSLSLPNGLDENKAPSPSVYSSSPSVYSSAPSADSADYTPGVPNADGSYAFAYSTGDSSRQEHADASGNVQGRYSYSNAAGMHDLSYVAGSQTGFLPTGGSLASPNGLEGSVTPYHASGSTFNQYDSSTGTVDDQADTGDASYSFTVDTDEYKRMESSDAQGNVQGSFSYKNAAGQHDLSFVAGKETGFLPTGGSLSLPNGLDENKASPSVYSSSPSVYSASPSAYSANVGNENVKAGDGSYSFVVDTPEYQRQESSDAQGNVQGRYSYTNAVGTHDLSYVAGASTGYVATGGSLATPNGIAQIGSPLVATAGVATPVVARANFDHGHSEHQVGNVHIKTYLPPESHSKYGYVFESS